MIQQFKRRKKSPFILLMSESFLEDTSSTHTNIQCLQVEEYAEPKQPSELTLLLK